MVNDVIKLNKLAEEAANEQNPKWKKMIERNKPLYNTRIDFRTDFQRDYTRVIYSNAYKRLKHKTQVFFCPTSDHVCTRIEHVNHVESISYMLAKAFGLNTELTKTISVSHDIGHSPFGHKGEKILSEILEKDVGKKFWHEGNGVECVDNIELLENREGQKENLNLTYAVRDGIISHCGEIDENSIKPRKEAIDLKDYKRPNEYSPYTWEGCIVKVADKISYLGRDIEDALRFEILDSKDLEELNKILEFAENGYNTLNNTNIINYLSIDLVKNSSLDNGLMFSMRGMELINRLKRFNYERIYNNERVKVAEDYFRLIILTIYDVLRNVYAENINKIEENPSAKFYLPVIHEFVQWLKNYCIENKDENLRNNKIYDIRKKEDYCSAIVE